MKLTMIAANDGIHYFVNGREVSETVYRAAKWETTPTDFKKGECPGMHPDYSDFRNETDTKTGTRGGRYYPQLAKFPGDKRAVMPSVKAATEVAKRRGYTVEAD